MAASVRTLLEESLYLSGVSDREFSPVDPDGSHINVALNYFINVLDSYRDEVPFWDEKFLNGEAELTNVGASAINFVEYLIGTTFFKLKRLTQLEFAEVDTIQDLRAIPEWYWFDEGNQQIKVYPLPDVPTRKFLIGFRGLPVITSLDQAIPASIKPFMQLFLQYEVAVNLANVYKLPWGNLQEATRAKYEQKLHDNSENMPSQPVHPNLSAATYPVPYLAYISGNTPGNF